MMKKRVLSIVTAVLMLAALIPFSGGVLAAGAGEYNAQFGAQMDPVDGWGLGEIAATTFNIGEPAVISIDFGETVSFGDGNYLAIETDMPNPFDGAGIFTDPGVAQVLSFKLDGEDVLYGAVLINAEGMDANDGSGPGLRLTLTNKWNGDILAQPFDPLLVDEFTTLEIEFIVRGTDRTEYTAQFGAQMDPVDGWGLGEIAATTFVIGEPAAISIDFGETVSFGDGNYIAIETDIPNPYEGLTIFPDPGSADILSFRLDGNEVDVGDVLLNAEGMDANDGSGPGLRLTIANKWNGDIEEQPVDPEGLGEFTTLDIEFIVYGMGMPVVVEQEPIGDVTGGNAWFGGTLKFSAGHPGADGDTDACEWWDFPEQSTEFEIGVPFTVTLDMGSDTVTYDVASWDGNIITVDSDCPINPMDLDVYVESIIKDGVAVPFSPAKFVTGQERGGIRVELHSSWHEDPPVASISDIGTFSKLEITMALVEYGAESPFGEMPVIEEPTPEPPPPSVAPITPPPSVDSSASSGGGLPTWAIVLIIAGAVVIVGVIVVIVLRGRKK